MMTDTKTHFVQDIETFTCQAFSLRILAGEQKDRKLSSNARMTRIGAHPDCEFDVKIELQVGFMHKLKWISMDID